MLILNNYFEFFVRQFVNIISLGYVAESLLCSADDVMFPWGWWYGCTQFQELAVVVHAAGTGIGCRYTCNVCTCSCGPGACGCVG